MHDFGIFGNPIKHSKSPDIYYLFSIETGIRHDYYRFFAEKENFEILLKNFFLDGGLGVNITVPFKEQAINLCDNLTNRATISGSVNVIKKLDNGLLLGDNTDGVGLINDLKRLNYLSNKEDSILVIGSGGAAHGVIASLLANNYRVLLFNRTFSHAQNLAKFFNNFKQLKILSKNQLINYNYNLIINTTSTSMYGVLPILPKRIINSATNCYDLFYQRKDTLFNIWCKEQGAKNTSDGLGMLVDQAAQSFLLWHNILPSVEPVLKRMRFLIK